MIHKKFSNPNRLFTKDSHLQSDGIVSAKWQASFSSQQFYLLAHLNYKMLNSHCLVIKLSTRLTQVCPIRSSINPHLHMQWNSPIQMTHNFWSSSKATWYLHTSSTEDHRTTESTNLQPVLLQPVLGSLSQIAIQAGFYLSAKCHFVPNLSYRRHVFMR